MQHCRLTRLARLCPVLFTLAAGFALCVGIGAPVRAQSTVTYFDEPLAPYGYWVEDPSYGRVWRPRDPGIDWRPYTYGRHAYPHSSGAIVCDLTTDTEVADGTRQG
jgi:hypothetical protein